MSHWAPAPSSSFIPVPAGDEKILALTLPDFCATQSKAGPDGKPLTDADLAAERSRLEEALARLDDNIGTARRDLQLLTRPDERELFESRLIILQVCPREIYVPRAPGRIFWR